VTTIKVFFKWLHKGGVFLADPAAPVIQRSVRSPLPAVLTQEEIERLLAAGEQVRRGNEERKADARPLLLLKLLLQTGIKKGEAMGIVPNHIDRSDPEAPTVFIRYKSPAKRYKERKIPLQPDWLPVLDEYLKQYAPPETLFTCTPRNLEYILHDLQEIAGVETALSFECTRWSSAVHSYSQGADTNELRQRMGLSEITWRETLSKIRRLADSLSKESG
jgi:integrase/recombinase XerD